MIWATLLALHLVGLVGYTLLLRKSALSEINKYALAALMQTAVFLPSLFFLLSGRVRFDLSATEWFTLASAGVLVVGLHLTAIRALQHLEASVFTIIYNSRLLFTTIFGYVFLNEIPPNMQIVGGVIIFASILMLNLHKNKQYLSKPVWYGLLASLWLSGYATLEKHIVVTIGFETYITLAGFLGALLLWLLAFKMGARLKQIKTHIDRQFAALLVLRPLSAWSFVLSFKYGSLAVANYVSGMSVPLIVVFGIVFLGEKGKIKKKILALTLAVIGLTVILISKL